jgi:pimeloyl-ACP methyl ester carboxylesterase
MTDELVAGRNGSSGTPVSLAGRPGASGGGRPIRKDEIELPERGLYIESWLPERRSRRKPLLFIHGELGGSWVWERYLGYFAGRGWEGHALNLRNHYWSQREEPTNLSFETYLADVLAAVDRLGPNVVIVGHGLGGLLGLRAAVEARAAGLVLLSPEPPRELRAPARLHELREIPDAYGRSFIGWETLPERLIRDHRDLTVADILRIQHLMGQKSNESGLARRQVLEGIAVDRVGLSGIPTIVIGAGLDLYVPEPATERLADWLGATYEPFGAHSHYGLVLGEQSYLQVAESVRSFLEAHRL